MLFFRGFLKCPFGLLKQASFWCVCICALLSEIPPVSFRSAETGQFLICLFLCSSSFRLRFFAFLKLDLLSFRPRVLRAGTPEGERRVRYVNTRSPLQPQFFFLHDPLSPTCPHSPLSSPHRSHLSDGCSLNRVLGTIDPCCPQFCADEKGTRKEKAWSAPLCPHVHCRLGGSGQLSW